MKYNFDKEINPYADLVYESQWDTKEEHNSRDCEGCKFKHNKNIFYWKYGNLQNEISLRIQQGELTLKSIREKLGL